MEYRERLCDSEEWEAIAELEQNGFHPLPARVLAARNIRTAKAAHELLSPMVSQLHDPFCLTDMQKAVDRIRSALNTNEKMAVYGDYDADGLTAAALLIRVLRSMGGDVSAHIPNRLTEGYGLRRDVLETMCGQNVTLVITVDTGVTAVEEVAAAAEMGMDCVITDHHECRDRLPAAVAVVNPRRPDCAYPFDGLAGVGVAFKLCAALCGDTESLLARYGELVAIGTIADLMPVTDENRVFISFGLRNLSKTRLPGLRALLRASGKREPAILRSQDVGFLLAPRINAAGRLGRAELALGLLLTCDPIEAEELARSLCELNVRRKQIEERIQSEALCLVDGTEAAIVPVGENWHQGVAGIVAAGLLKRFQRPVFLVCLDGDEARGSARGVPGCNLVEVLSALSRFLTEYGGHELAAGFSLNRRDVADFKAALIHHCASLRLTVPPLACEAPVKPGWFTLEALRFLEALEPFGAGFPAPVFVLRDLYLISAAPMGQGKHCRLQFNTPEGRVTAVWFGHTAPALETDSLFDIAFTASVNRFQGTETAQLQIVDMQASARQADLDAQLALYRRFHAGGTLRAEDCKLLLPERDEIADVWRSLGTCEGSYGLVGWVPPLRRHECSIGYGKIWMSLDILQELGLCRAERHPDGSFCLERCRTGQKADLLDSTLLNKLRSMVEGGDTDG